MRLVTAPDGRTWKVFIHWAARPRWHKLRVKTRSKGRKKKWDWLDWLDLRLDLDVDGFQAVLLLLVVAAFFVFMIFVGWPAILFLLETLWLLVALLAGLVVRVLFRRPWLVVAETDGIRPRPPERLTWDVVGWRRSRRALADAESALREGRAVPGTLPDVGTG